MVLKNIKIPQDDWKELSKHKLELNLKKISDVININIKFEKKFNNEKEFSKWFEFNYHLFGFDKITKKREYKFPDFQVLYEGKKIEVELETLSSNFILHNHNPKKVDLVICLIKDKNIPVKTIEISPFKLIGGDIITFKGERELWIDFVAKIKKDKKKVWEVLKLLIKKYLKEK